MAAGLKQAFLSQAMSKPLHGGHAADAGVLAALAAAQGVTGALDIIEGKEGFGQAMSINPDWTKVVRGLGVDYHIQHMTFKAHGCCGHTFPSIDGVLHLVDTHTLKADDIQKITLATYKAGLDIIDNAQPQGEYQAKFSLQYTVAHALLYGSVRLNAFTPERMSDPAIRSLMKKIVCVADPVLSEGYPNQRAAQVDIDLKDGSRLSYFQPYRKGDPELPLTDEELNAKFKELADPVLGQVRAERLLEQLWSLEKRPNAVFSF